jgi:hypothetical protein
MFLEQNFKRFEEKVNLSVFLLSTEVPHVFLRRNDGGSEKLDFGDERLELGKIIKEINLRNDCDFIDVTGNNKFTGLADGIRLRELCKKK